MAESIALTSVAIPLPQPYDSKYPTQQQENFFYVLNQLLLQGQAIWKIPDPERFAQALDDLRMVDVTFDFGFMKVSINGKMEWLG